MKQHIKHDMTDQQQRYRQYKPNQTKSNPNEKKKKVYSLEEEVQEKKSKGGMS